MFELEDNFRDTSHKEYKAPDAEIMIAMMGQMKTLLRKQNEMLKQSAKTRRVHYFDKSGNR